MSDDTLEHMILMPRRGLRARASPLSAAAAPFLEYLHGLSGTDVTYTTTTGVRCRVLDSIRDDGPKLVELARGDIPAMRAVDPTLDLVPVVYYRPALAPRPTAVFPGPAFIDPAASQTIRLTVVDAATDRPIAGARISAFTDFATQTGQDVISDDDGVAVFGLGAGPIAIERLYVNPPMTGYWGHFRRDVALTDGQRIALQPIDLGKPDALRHFYAAGSVTAGAGVTVGIIDGGVGPHPDLVCEGDADNGSGHGTHVAGIIASRGSAPAGVRGLAPGVKLRSYRVLGMVPGLAANFSITKAIDAAIHEDRCDLINLSFNLFDASEDLAVRTALEDARAAGVLPIAAAGNFFRQPVGFPARDPICIAVSALGRRGTFPADSLEAVDIVAPFGRDDSDFIAAFSNFGPEIDLTAPGLGIISTVPGGYGIMSGTSMACPAVTGVAARVLAGNEDVLTMTRGPERSARLAQLVLTGAASLGFTADLQGAGLLQVQADA
jgi:subtilisin